jgi:tetratricopeptide (TPR) repeat protein
MDNLTARQHRCKAATVLTRGIRRAHPAAYAGAPLLAFDRAFVTIIEEPLFDQDVTDMPTPCRICSRINPAEANYCFFDGVFLQGSQLLGPADVAQTAFARPFDFPTGESCQNFDQLALTCQQHWKETWELLKNQSLANFLGQVGRADLIGVARHAAAEADPDRGVDYFLSHLPARNLAAPRLQAAPAHMKLGTLKAGQDRDFSVRLTNEGHRLIVGSVTSDSAWLQVEAAAPGQPHLVQFTQEQAVRVRVLGARLPAGQNARAAKLLLESNAGSAEIDVSCDVPIVPYPDGVLAGCRSPREVAVKAKHALKQAGELFYQGKVQAWYRSNGWTYPVEGEPASGKAAVQQFFEALGLTKPPQVILDTPALGFQGPPGKLLRQSIQLHTDDNRPIFAFGQAMGPWLNVVGHATNTNRAVVAVEVNVPHAAVQRLESQIEVRANGNQRFLVPVVLNIEAAPPGEYVPGPRDAGAPSAYAGAHAATPPQAAPAPGGTAGSCLLWAGLTLFLFALFGFCSGGIALYLYQNPDILAGPSPLEPYAAAIAPQTCVAIGVDLLALEATPALENETRQLQNRIGLLFRDLDLQGDDPTPRNLFVALERGERPLTVWTFGSKISLGKVGPGRYEIEGKQADRLCIDRLDPTLAWAVDGQGRLLGGPPSAVRGVRDREKKRQRSAAYENLKLATKGIPNGAPIWAAGDFAVVGQQAQAGVLGDDSPPPYLQHFHLTLEADSPTRFVLHGSAAFTSPTAATTWRDAVRALPNTSLPLLPATLDLNGLVREPSAWQVVDNDLRLSVKLDRDTPQALLRSAAADLDTADQRAKKSLKDLSQQFCKPGVDAVEKGDYAKAVTIFEKGIELFPNHGEARALLQNAKNLQVERNSYDAGLQLIRDALDRGDVTAARAAADKLKNSPRRDNQLGALEKAVAKAEDLDEFGKELKEAQRLAGRDELDKARDSFKRALALKPNDRTAAMGLAAIKRVQEVQSALKLVDQHLRDDRLKIAHQELLKCLDELGLEAKAKLWADEPFKSQRVRLLKAGGLACRQVCDALKNASDTAKASAERLLKQNKFVEGQKQYEKAQENLERAKIALADLRRVAGEAAVSPTELKAIDADLDLFRNSGKKIKTKSLVAQGHEGLKLAKLALIEAPADPALVGPALKAVETTLKLFREAEELEPRVATEPIREAEDLRKSLARILRPVALDLSTDLSSADWVFQKEQWTRKTGEEKRWLQAVPFAAVQLKSATQDWPADFELTLEFALVDTKKSVANNSLWVRFPDPVKLVLHHADGKTTTVSLGLDPALPGQPFARLQLDKKQITIGVKQLGKTEPIRLLLQRKKGQLKATLNQKLVGSVPIAGTIRSLTLHVDNPDMEVFGQRWFVAIYRLDVAWTGLEDGKANSP